jgi:hypothetical protein
MERPLLLYSTNTLLGYSIAERFYRGVHYAWCSPVFDGQTTAMHINIPPTSSPSAIYRQLWEETTRGEMHSTAIRRIKGGIEAGADAKLATGVIDAVQHHGDDRERQHPRVPASALSHTFRSRRDARV